MKARFSASHVAVIDGLHKLMQNSGAAAALSQLRAANIPWLTILTVVLQQLPNIEAGNWAAVIAALVGLLGSTASS